jgi:hypothetical protein
VYGILGIDVVVNNRVGCIDRIVEVRVVLSIH